MVEVRSDRTVFNIQGTINSAGTDALSLMRKAPGVTVDNNDNISVLGRAGVLIYLDGKRLPLSAQDLSAYLQSLPADQIDRIDIITNPGSRYSIEKGQKSGCQWIAEYNRQSGAVWPGKSQRYRKLPEQDCQYLWIRPG
jgi:hypothetical protein